MVRCARVGVRTRSSMIRKWHHFRKMWSPLYAQSGLFHRSHYPLGCLTHFPTSLLATVSKRLLAILSSCHAKALGQSSRVHAAAEPKGSGKGLTVRHVANGVPGDLANYLPRNPRNIASADPPATSEMITT